MDNRHNYAKRCTVTLHSSTGVAATARALCPAARDEVFCTRDTAIQALRAVKRLARKLGWWVAS